MGVLQRLTLENLRKNKRRTIVTIIGVTLATALMLAVAGIVTSFQQMMIDYSKAEVGDYHDMYENVSAEDLTYVEDNVQVESYYYAEPLTTKQIDEELYEMYQTYQNEPYQRNLYEELKTIEKKPGKQYNIFVRYKEPKDYETARENIVETLEKETGEPINVRTNGDLLRAEALAMNDAFLSSLLYLAAIVIGIIIATSVFVIRNSFSISAAERAKQFGMLASIGATPRQIRHSVLFEGLVIAGVGIPCGLALGSLAVAILVLIINFLLDGIVLGKVAFSMPFWIFPLAILLSLGTVILASLLPAIRAGKMSPIEAIRGGKEIKIKARRLRTSKLVNKIFGIGGVIADKNIKRSRKKYRTTIISIVLAVATFVGLSSFMGYGEKTLGLEFADTDIDVEVYGATPELIDKIVAHDQVKDYVYYRSVPSRTGAIFVVEPEYFKEYAKSVGVTKDFEHAVIMNDYGMTQYEDGSYGIERVYDTKEGETYNTQVFTKYKSESTYEYEYDEASLKDVALKITKVTDQAPLVFDATPVSAIFVSEDYEKLADLHPGNYPNLFISHLDNVEEIVEYVQNLIDADEKYEDAEVINYAERQQQTRRIYLLIAIFLYGFIIVVMLIGITNIFNTITTNIALRTKEFAMLKSVGMTSKEFNRMVRLESFMYASKSLLIGLPLGILLSYGVYKAMANAIDFGFIMPWSAIVIAIIAVGLLIWVIMTYSVRQVEKQNIIDAIREDNI